MTKVTSLRSLVRVGVKGLGRPVEKSWRLILLGGPLMDIYNGHVMQHRGPKGVIRKLGTTRDRSRRRLHVWALPLVPVDLSIANLYSRDSFTR